MRWSSLGLIPEDQAEAPCPRVGRALHEAHEPVVRVVEMEPEEPADAAFREGDRDIGKARRGDLGVPVHEPQHAS